MTDRPGPGGSNAASPISPDAHVDSGGLTETEENSDLVTAEEDTSAGEAALA